LKTLRVTIIVLVTAFVMGFGLALLSAFLVARGERPIPEMTRLTMIIGMTGVVGAVAAGLGGNRRIARASRAEEKEEKQCTPVADRATVYVFRDAWVARAAGFDLLLDGTPVGQTRALTFYRLRLTPGEHVLASRNPRDGSQYEHRVSAGPGSLLFLEQQLKIGMTAMRHELVPADQTKASKRVRRCRLLSGPASL